MPHATPNFRIDAKIKNALLKLGRIAAVLIVAALTIQGAREAHYYFSHTRHNTSRLQSHELRPAPIDSSWIISGSPRFFSNVFTHSPGTLSGIWKCIGPGKFVWHYSVDEAIYILEGSAEIEYLGKRYVLHAADSIFFSSGTSAVWTVRDVVKKTFRIRSRGPLTNAIHHISSYF